MVDGVRLTIRSSTKLQVTIISSSRHPPDLKRKQTKSTCFGSRSSKPLLVVKEIIIL